LDETTIVGPGSPNDLCPFYPMTGIELGHKGVLVPVIASSTEVPIRGVREPGDDKPAVSGVPDREAVLMMRSPDALDPVQGGTACGSCGGVAPGAADQLGRINRSRAQDIFSMCRQIGCSVILDPLRNHPDKFPIELNPDLIEVGV